MPRYKLIVEYDGTSLKGWQYQENLPTAQGYLEEAVFSLSGEQVEVYGAGRTDAGVHAIGQVAHFDITKEHDPYKVWGALNFYLRETPVSILQVEQVDEKFHARFSAKQRSYLYRIINRRADLALERYRAWHVIPSLDAEAMHDAAQALVGTHDFNSFRSSECQAKSSIKTLDSFSVTRVSEEEIHCRTTSLSFLHHQVRNMVGTLMLVGSGKWTRQDIIAALHAKNRSAAGQTAPAHGLYFTQVIY